MITVTRNDVRKQLKGMGFKSVPEDVLDEFVRDLVTLSQSEAANGHHSKTENSHPPSTPPRGPPVHEQGTPFVISPLSGFGSPSPARLNVTGRAGRVRTDAKGKRQRAQAELQDPLGPWDGPTTTGASDVEPQEETLDKEVSRAPATAPPGGRKQKQPEPIPRPATAPVQVSRISRMSGEVSKSRFETSRATVGVLGTRGPPAKHRSPKSDPVKRWQEMNGVWRTDRFLTRKWRRPLKPIHLVVDDSSKAETARPRHDMAAMRNKYVPPTDKRRDDLRWHVRETMFYMAE